MKVVINAKRTDKLLLLKIERLNYEGRKPRKPYEVDMVWLYLKKEALIKQTKEQYLIDLFSRHKFVCNKARAFGVQ